MQTLLNDASPDLLPADKAIHYAECPHCHHEVMLRADGKCIACGKSRFDTAGLDPDQTMVTIENVSQLPACCFLCASATRRLQRFTWNYRIKPEQLPPWMIPFVTLMSYVPGSQYRSSERLRLPVCPACAKAARQVRPLSIWTGLDCRLMVHREFRARFEALNGRQRLEWEAEARGRSLASGKGASTGLGIRL